MGDKDLKTEDGIAQYLKHKSLDCTKVIRLTEGGFSAYLFRGELATPLPSGNVSIIIKHVTELAAGGFNFPLDPSRLVYDYRGLSLLSPLLSTQQVLSDDSKTPVHLPSVIQFDEVDKILIIQDVGPHQSLKSWLRSGSTAVSLTASISIGHTLGTFLADLHDLSTSTPSILAQFEGNRAGRELSAYVYFRRLASEASKLGFDESFIAEAASQANDEVLTASEVPTMGDFWTGNVLVCDQGSQIGGELPGLWVIDWELAKPGTGEFDIGQMAAEMYFLVKFGNKKGAEAMLEAFLKTYRMRREVDAYRVAVRVGAHMVVFRQMAKANAPEEEIRGLAEEGVEFIKAGWMKDGAFLRGSVLAPLLN